MISSTDRSDRTGSHCWSILDLHPKKEKFLLDSCGVVGLKNYLIQDDKKIVDKILVDNKLRLVKTTFSIAGFKYLANKELKRLSPRTKDLFRFIDKFGKLQSIEFKVVIHMLEDQIQKIETITVYFNYTFARTCLDQNMRV